MLGRPVVSRREPSQSFVVVLLSYSLLYTLKRCHLALLGISTVNASGTTLISAGRVPINSPSAST
jgi:hypothetical protein